MRFMRIIGRPIKRLLQRTVGKKPWLGLRRRVFNLRRVESAPRMTARAIYRYNKSVEVLAESVGQTLVKVMPIVAKARS